MLQVLQFAFFFHFFPPLSVFLFIYTPSSSFLVSTYLLLVLLNFFNASGTSVYFLFSLFSSSFCVSFHICSFFLLSCLHLSTPLSFEFLLLFFFFCLFFLFLFIFYYFYFLLLLFLFIFISIFIFIFLSLLAFCFFSGFLYTFVFFFFWFYLSLIVESLVYKQP